MDSISQQPPTPTQATSVPMPFKTGTMWLPRGVIIAPPSAGKLTLCDAALQAGIEGIAREDGDEFRLASEPGIVSIVVDKRLESSDAADGLGRRRVYMVYIVVVKQPDIGRPLGCGGWFKDRGFAFRRDHIINY
jgi:hypothetical protein